MSIVPLNDYVLIKQDSHSEKVGSIIIDSRPPQSGTVLAVGPKCVDVEVGQRVQFELGEFQRMSLEGQDVLFVKESKIIGVFYNE